MKLPLEIKLIIYEYFDPKDIFCFSFSELKFKHVYFVEKKVILDINIINKISQKI